MISTIKGGFDKDGLPERVRSVDVSSGEVIGIVGPTGSGKSSLISDLEQFAQGDTPSRRYVLIDGSPPDPEMRHDPRRKPVAQLSQNMHFLADMRVCDFICMHARSRGRDPGLLSKVLEITNTLTGEPVHADDNLTELSGGQSRALMVADIAVISDSPIVLIDEIENAGIRKKEALRLLSGEGKIVLVVTHDPLLALMTERRIVMRNGGMVKIIKTTEEERRFCDSLFRVDTWLLSLRESIRRGDVLSATEAVI